MEQPNRGERLTAILLVIAAAIAGGVFFYRFSAARIVPGRVVAPAAACLLVAVAALAWGEAFLRGARMVARRVAGLEGGREIEPLESFLVGVPVYGLVLSILAWAGLIQPLVVAVLTLASAAVGGLRTWRPLSRIRFRPTVGEALLLVPPVLIAIAGAITPVNSPDELVYKLAVPRTYQLFGRMLELPLNSDSYFPSAVYMADLGAMILGTGIAAKLLHFLVYLAALAVIRRLASRLSEPAAPWITAVVAWTPALAIISGWAWAEWAMVAFVLLSFDRWHDFLESGSATDLAVSAAALGAALSTKYTALPWLVVFLPLAFLRVRNRERSGAILGAAALIVTAAGGLFYLRNLIWTGSPVAPFLLPLSPAIANYRSKASGWAELLRGWDIFHEGIIDDSLGVVFPAMVLVSPAALLARNRRITDLFLLGAAQFAGLVTLAPTSRLMLLALVPLAILGGLAVARLWAWCRQPWRLVMGAAAGAALFGQLLLVALVFVTSWTFIPYLVGVESEAGYLARTRDFYAPWTWIGENTPAEATLLLLGENRSYYLPRKAISAGNLDGPRMAAWLAQAASPSAMASQLAGHGITHVVIHKPWYRVGDPQSAPMSMLEKEYLLVIPPSTDAVLKGCLAKFGRRVYEDRSYVIFALPSLTR